MYLLARLALALIVGIAPAISRAADPPPRSVLILDQSGRESAWFEPFFAAFRSTLGAKSTAHVSIYAEHLDLNRFGGTGHDERIRTYLREKFSERPIGVVVAQGSPALEFVLRSRAELWPKVPVVFASVDEATLARLQLPRDVTGTTYQLAFRDAVTAAQALVPGLKRIALVGDPFDRQAVRSHFKQEVPLFAAELELIDLTGLPMAEVRRRVAALPADTAIVYTSITLDGAGVAYVPHEALAAIADAANRPIVIDTETSLGYGGAGGLLVSPGPVGEAAALLALRILDGEEASGIPVAKGGFARPIFDSRQLQRFGISADNLPPGSEIRFRPPSLWGQYRWQAIAALAVVLIQAALILWLLFERHARKRAAEQAARARVETGQYRENLARLVRVHTAGEMSAALAHEINQPLGAIENYALAARRRMGGESPDLGRVADLLDKLIGQTTRAGDVVTRMRGMLQRHELEPKEIDVARAVRECVDMVKTDCDLRDVRIELKPADGLALVVCDEIHLQQVILNLLRNAMEAVEIQRPGVSKEITIEVGRDGAEAVSVRVADRGAGIADGDLERVFESFYSTKPGGLGIGLAICRKLIEAHGGTLWASHNPGGGAAFQFTLPAAVLIG